MKYIFIFALLLAGCSSFHQQSPGTRAPSADTSLSALQPPWGPEYFTDPAQHNPKSFRYLIHATVNTNSLAEMESQLVRTNSSTKDSAPYILSASVISESRGIAYSESVFSKDEIGFVVTAPAPYFLAAYKHDGVVKNQWNADGTYAHPEDGYTGPNNFEEYKSWLFQQNGLRSPQELLNITYVKISDGRIIHNYNEVDIVHGPELRATAVFFFDSKMANLPRREEPARTARLKKIAQQLAKKYNLPFLSLKAPPILTQVD